MTAADGLDPPVTSRLLTHGYIMGNYIIAYYGYIMIKILPPFKGLNIRIPIITPIKGRWFTNEGSALVTSG